MRITTQMLNESARQAGLPINRSTLLDYIKNDGATNPLLEAMNRNKENVANTAKKSNYEKLDKEADQLTQSAQVLLQNGENSLFEQAKACGDNQKVYDSIENLFENRFKHVGELLKMGCDIRTRNGVVIVSGREKIYGAEVLAFCFQLLHGISPHPSIALIYLMHDRHTDDPRFPTVICTATCTSSVD